MNNKILVDDVEELSIFPPYTEHITSLFIIVIFSKFIDSRSG